MPIDPKPGLRVQHQKHGLGTIDSVQSGDQGPVVFVEHDDGVVRRYVLALCTLTTLDGDPLVAPPQTHVEHPPTDQIAKPPPAPTPKGTTMPAKPITAVDNLLDDMEAALRERGPDAKPSLAAACGLVPSSLRNWRHAGRIPAQHRDAVAAWIWPSPEKPKPKAKAVPAKANPRPRGTIPAPAKANPRPRGTIPPPAHRLDAPALLAALGFTLTDAWIPDGDTLRRARVAVLPA
jgi:hypothetical protein